MEERVYLIHEYQIEALTNLSYKLRKKYYKILLKLVKKNESDIVKKYTKFLTKRDAKFKNMTDEDWEEEIQSLLPDPSVNKYADKISKWANKLRKMESKFDIAKEARELISSIDITESPEYPRSPESPKYRRNMLKSRKYNCSDYYDELNSLDRETLLSYSEQF